MKHFFALQLVCTCFLAAAVCGSSGGVESLPPGKQFHQDFSELLGSLEQARLLPDLSGEQEADLLQNVLHRLAIPAVITNLDPAIAELAPAASPALQVLARKEGILYLRLDNFHQPEPVQTAVLIEEFHKLQGQALILDLRHSSGFSPDAESDNLRMLKAMGAPLLILIDSATAGTPESLVRKLQAETPLLVMGKPSTGIGGAGREIKLSSGLTIRVPQFERDQLPAPLEPDVELQETPYRAEQLDASADSWCRLALDTLKVILTLQQN